MPRKVVKGTTENLNMLREKVDYIGFELGEVPEFLKDFEPLEYRVPKVYDETTYKVYKYVKIKDIEILITPKDRLDDLEERYKLASPLFTYMKPEANENLEKYAYFLKMINQTRVSDIQEIEKEQEAFQKEIPFDVKFANNFKWQIFYSDYADKYFMLASTNETDNSPMFYLLKKKIETCKSKSEKDFALITNVNDKFLNRETGIYAEGSQTELSVPLQWKIVPEELIGKVAANLAHKVEEDGFHLDVGVLGAKAILNALSENGYAETAYKVAVQDTYPSWGWWMVNGATTLLENWDLQATRDISDNHMMFGEIGAWFYKGLGGIFPDPAQPGFQNILLRPHFIKGLKRFEARHRSPYGEIVSRWEWKGKCVHYEVTVPANSTATLTLPDKAENVRVVELAAGKYEFIVK